MNEGQSQKPMQRMPEARVAKMKPKAVMWVIISASVIALMSFSLLFIHAAYRNGWW